MSAAANHLLVRVGKAHGTGTVTDDIPNLVIEIGPDPVQIHKTHRESATQFQSDARKIVTGLTESLPGGTLDQVLHLLLERKASQLVVRG